MKIQKVDLNPNLKLMDRNQKSAKTDRVHFLLWNLPSAKTCPYATPLCRKHCFGVKQENGYNPKINESRENAYQESLKPSFVEDMIQYIEWYLQKTKVAGKVCYLRIHGTGDFYSLEYLKKWKQITDHFKGDHRIRFQCYSKSMPFFKKLLKEESLEHWNLKWVWSVFEDTPESYTQTAKELNLTIFTALPKKKIPNAIEEGSFLCKGKCGECEACYKGSVPQVVIPYH